MKPLRIIYSPTPEEKHSSVRTAASLPPLTKEVATDTASVSRKILEPVSTSNASTEAKQPRESNSATSTHTRAGAEVVKKGFTVTETAAPLNGCQESELNDLPVEACLEYLMRPHISWDSVISSLQRRRERVERHGASIMSRSLASTRSNYFASTVSSSMESSISSSSVVSVATAPAGFPRTSKNGSKTCTGTLRRGRLYAAPSHLESRSEKQAQTSKGIPARRPFGMRLDQKTPSLTGTVQSSQDVSSLMVGGKCIVGLNRVKHLGSLR
ncbi:unnamed protein product [Phytomonas sp. Hart1]|nr:unnamed protein product [Phytomonas sp. Hart1]|eukprot:CCW67496.1 unnamed protein product [Phytomonas sp. isolate Hart1]